MNHWLRSGKFEFRVNKRIKITKLKSLEPQLLYSYIPEITNGIRHQTNGIESNQFVSETDIWNLQNKTKLTADDETSLSHKKHVYL